MMSTDGDDSQLGALMWAIVVGDLDTTSRLLAASPGLAQVCWGAPAERGQAGGPLAQRDAGANPAGGGERPSKASTAASTKICLSPQAKRSWKDRKLSFEADEATLGNRSVEVIARDGFGPLVGKATVLDANLRNLANAVGGPDPICGNWCGANRRYMGDDPQSVDKLDTACRKHDFCTREQRISLSGKGPSCFCDQQLADEILRGRNIVSLSPAQKSVVMHLQGSACGGGCKRVDNMQVCGR